MWIEELYIDEFDVADNLALRRLTRGINVIRLPSPAAAERLAQFLPAVLYGSDATDGSLAGGSLIVHTATANGHPTTLDLCRLPVGDQGELSELQILDTEGETLATEELLPLQSISAELYRATFTDQLPPAARLASWRNSPLVAKLLRKGRSRRPPRVLPRVATQQGPIAPTIAPTEPLSSPVTSTPAACSDSRTNVDRVALWQVAARQWRLTCEQVSAPRPAVANDTHESPPSDLRQRYFSAYDRAQLLRQQIASLRDEQQKAEALAQNWEAAARLRERWLQLAQLAEQLQQLPRLGTGTAQQLAELQRLEREIVAQRELVQQQRNQLERSERAVVDRSQATERQRRLAELLAAWPACEAREQRCAALRAEWAALPERGSPPSSSEPTNSLALTPAQAETAIRQIRELTAARQQAAAALQRRSTARITRPGKASQPTTASAEASRVEAPVGSPVNTRRASLQRQIRQLKDETRQLLSRQLLSRQAILGIGLLFSGGVTVLLSSLLLELGGTELAIGSIGLTCILSSLLLKVSFERTPSGKLREQRLRVTQLIAELQQLSGAPMTTHRHSSPTSSKSETVNAGDPADTSQGPAPDVNDAAESIVPMRRTAQGAGQRADAELSRRREALAATDLAWHELLQSLQFPVELTPAQAILEMRQRTEAVVPLNADPLRHFAEEERRCQLQSEIAAEQSQIDAWCDRAAVTLRDAAEPTDGPFSSDASTRAFRADPATSATEWHRQVQAEVTRLAHANHLTHEEIATAKSQLAAAQQRLKELKLRRSELLVAAGADSLSSLQAQLEQAARRAAGERQYESRSAEWAAELRAEPAGEQIQQWLSDGVDVAAEQSAARQTSDATKLQLVQAQQALQLSLAEISELSQSRATLAQVPAADQEAQRESQRESWARILLSALLERQATESAMRATKARAEFAAEVAAATTGSHSVPELTPGDGAPAEMLPVSDAAPAERSSAAPSESAGLLSFASRLLQRITGVRGLFIEWDGPQAPIQLADGDQRRMTLESLPADRQAQVVTALQLSLARRLSRRFGALPIVLSDQPLTAGDSLASRWARLLLQFADAEQQVFVLTTSPRAAAIFQDLSLPILIVSRQRVEVQEREELSEQDPAPLDPEPTSEVNSARWQALAAMSFRPPPPVEVRWEQRDFPR